ncbi:hypothetical protein OIU34_02480 [Pararhizobium sp. BT-229]|uniref:hypothetical protein n=1 Tax=Pararhizobium sp. BT-229 TaxID=2986923 RepID=UPI0021F6DDDE|nr:hypothetical protein [Pararhizobium sp. BT-229]MCV9960754.1 hypothetical protein [Pararhizobium sp. BT-229]
MKRYRIRRCTGNRDAWCLIRLRDDGTESNAYGSYSTAMSLDTLLSRAGHLTPRKGDSVELAVLTKERANQIIDAQASGPFGSEISSYMRRAEIADVREVWKTVPGTWSFRDVVVAIANNTTLHPIAGQLLVPSPGQ